MIDEQNPNNQTSNPVPPALDEAGKQTGDAIPNDSNPRRKFRIKERFSKWWEKREAQWKDTLIHDRTNVRLTRIIATSSVLYTIFAGWTLYEIHSGSSDTHALAVAAKTQADLMNRQLSDFRTVQAGRLSIEDWSVIRAGGEDRGDKQMADFSFTVKWNIYNRGNSMLFNIAWSEGHDSHIDDAQAWENAAKLKVTPSPVARGPDLAPNTQPVEISFNPPTTEQLGTGGLHVYYQWVKIVGVDIFGEERYALACFRSYKAGGYIPCFPPTPSNQK